MFGEDSRLRLIGFHGCNLYDPDRLLRTVVGSPSYAAPEVARGAAYIGPEVDVWSLGAVLYFMLAGRPPFEGSGSLPEAHNQIQHGDYEIPDYVSAGLQRSLPHPVHSAWSGLPLRQTRLGWSSGC
jgi:serine/threonine protein kinase